MGSEASDLSVSYIHAFPPVAISQASSYIAPSDGDKLWSEDRCIYNRSWVANKPAKNPTRRRMTAGKLLSTTFALK